ncbi:MAG: hypothetical protein WC785_08175 [Tatlockia sp.]
MKKIGLMACTGLLGFSTAFATSSINTNPHLALGSLVDNILSPSLYQNPFMAPNNFSESHANSYQTDTVSIPGPDASASRKTQDALLNSPTLGSGTIAFDNQGRIVMLRVSVNLGIPIVPYDNNLLLIDPQTLTVLDTAHLPNIAPFSTISYFYVDNLNRVIVPTPTQNIYIYAINQNQYQLANSYDLTGALNAPIDVIASVLPDNAGNLWFSSQLGTIGYINPTTGQIVVTHLASSGGSANERITKSMATDEHGGVYIVSSVALYRFQADTSGNPTSTWRTTYDRGTRIKSGQFQQGSGTTPTLFNDFEGNQFVTIADNSDPYMHVLVYNRETGALVAQQAVFTKFPYATSCENSLVAVNHSVIIENNYGSTGSGLVTTSGDLTSIPGIARVDFNPNSGEAETVWTNYDISIPSAITRLSTANGLLYTFAKDAKSWYFATLDFHRGKVTEKVRIATTGVLAGSLANNFFSGAGIGFDGSAYIPTIGGMTVWRASHNDAA